MSDKKLKDKVAVVTGGGRGIGKAICLAFAREGASVMVASNVKAENENVAEMLRKKGNEAFAYTVDTTDVEQVAGLAAEVKKRFGKLDILANNAGVVGKRAFTWEFDDKIFRRTMEVNLFGTHNVTKALLPLIIAQKKGRVINTASINGKLGSFGNAPYSASKHGVIGLTRTLAIELCMAGLSGITVNAVCPGVTNTDMLTGPGEILDDGARMLGKTREQVLKEIVLPMSAQRRLMEPEEIAEAFVYLASDDAKGITGQAINVCGGSVFY
jgi:NAD(P)-dependent dehydrogenase (short-subunit alcohol dehydrogenase family)